MAIQSFQQAMESDHMPFSIFIDGHEYEGYYANVRIDRNTLPLDWYAYDIRDNDSDGNPCEIKNGYIIVNHLATFYTQDPLPLKEGESLYYEGEDDPNNGFDYSFS